MIHNPALSAITRTKIAAWISSGAAQSDCLAWMPADCNTDDFLQKKSVIVRSTDFTEAHFDAKAERYQAALGIAPFARTFEVLPFLLFLNDRLTRRPEEDTAADLLCGSGFLTSAVRHCFARVVGIDVSSGMLSRYPAGDDVIAMKAALDEHSSALRDEVRPGVILALAGLHHVYETSNGRVDQEASEALQINTILAWVASLPANGVAVLADVTDPGVPVQYSADAGVLSNRHHVLAERFAFLAAQAKMSIGSPTSSLGTLPGSLDAYLRTVLAFCPTSGLPSPGDWFRHVVAEHGQFGHVDSFLNPARIVAAVRAAGYSVHYHELPTPWVFPSEETFMRFFYDKFVFGPTLRPDEAIPDRISRLIRAQAQRYLGIEWLSSGAVAVGWRLGYYVISRS